MESNRINAINELKINIFSRAKIFIETIGSFAPFGAKYIDGKIIDVVYDSDEENIINSQIAIDKIISSFSLEVLHEKAKIAAIAYDINANFKNADGVSVKRDALCLKITDDGSNWSEEYFPYILVDGNCVWM